MRRRRTPSTDHACTYRERQAEVAMKDDDDEAQHLHIYHDQLGRRCSTQRVSQYLDADAGLAA